MCLCDTLQFPMKRWEREKWSGEGVVGRGRTRDAKVVMEVKDGCGGWVHSGWVHGGWVYGGWVHIVAEWSQK